MHSRISITSSSLIWSLLILLLAGGTLSGVILAVNSEARQAKECEAVFGFVSPPSVEANRDELMSKRLVVAQKLAELAKVVRAEPKRLQEFDHAWQLANSCLSEERTRSVPLAF